MDQDQIVSIVLSCDAGFREETRQAQYHQVRFYGLTPDKSINIGYSEQSGCFVADFVFKGAAPAENISRAQAFARLFGGAIPDRPTVFVRLMPTYAAAGRLRQLIQAYAAIEPGA